jgi:hypothetical protein
MIRVVAHRTGNARKAISGSYSPKEMMVLRKQEPTYPGIRKNEQAL